MDDPLRHKTLQLSCETVLWYEFLLDPTLLTKHLAKGQNSGTQPIELINQFLSISTETQANQDVCNPTPETFEPELIKIVRKQLALKILGLKVASHLKWNLEIFERNLPLPKQLQLLSDLCTVTAGQFVSLPMLTECQLGPEGNQRAFNFALILYHRWILRAQVLKELPVRVAKPGFGLAPTGYPEQDVLFRDELFVASLESFTQTSLDFLQKLFENNDDIFISLTYDSFVALSSNSDLISQNFDVAIHISRTEVKTQICFDLCTFYLHIKKYDLARENAIACRNSLAELKLEYEGKDDKEFVFCTLNEDELNGCMLACGVADMPVGLLHRMSESALQKYAGITDILCEDNFVNEIPLVSRRILELDLEAAAQAAKITRDILVQVAALNTIKSVLQEHNLFSFNDFLQKYRNDNGLAVMVKYATPMLGRLTPDKTNKLKQFFLNVMLSSPDWHNDADVLARSRLFSAKEWTNFKRQRAANDILSVPNLSVSHEWKTRESNLRRLDIGTMKRNLIYSTDANEVRKLLDELSATNPTKPLYTINPSWMVPDHLKLCIMDVRRVCFHDLAYILVGKSREMAFKNNFGGAISMLSALKSECERKDLQHIPAVIKLVKQVDWEILLIQMQHTLEIWPKQRYDRQQMAERCKECIAAISDNDTIIPRAEIIETCAAMLLNLNELNYLLTVDKWCLPAIELCSALAAATIESDVVRPKKQSRGAWDLVLPMFLQSKARGPGQGGHMAHLLRESSTWIVAHQLTPTLKRLRNVQVISVVLSLLSRIHNILKNDTNMELMTEHLAIWPHLIGNSTTYSIRCVFETLSNLLKQARSYYPNQTPWIRLAAELEFVAENNEAAMGYYVNFLLTGSEYCTLNIRPLLDDHIIKRMIKTSLNLGCNMQAAILCQFQEEIDYMLAFKCIAEKPITNTSSCDAMDAYYNCIWDPTLLEYIVQHHCKKGEHKLKQQAIGVLNQLELNSNNNDEIKREAASIRRTRFLRALAKQYIL